MDKASLLKSLLSAVVDSDDRKVIKRIPMKKEWRKMWEDYIELANEIKDAQNEADSKRALFWGTVETDTGIFNNTMRVDERVDDDEILVLASLDDEDEDTEDEDEE